MKRMWCCNSGDSWKKVDRLQLLLWRLLFKERLLLLVSNKQVSQKGCCSPQVVLWLRVLKLACPPLRHRRLHFPPNSLAVITQDTKNSPSPKDVLLLKINQVFLLWPGFFFFLWSSGRWSAMSTALTRQERTMATVTCSWTGSACTTMKPRVCSLWSLMQLQFTGLSH